MGAHAANQTALFRFLDLYAIAHARPCLADRPAELAAAARDLFHKAWTGKPIRLLGVYAQSLEATEGQTNLIDEPRAEDWRRTLAAVDKIREKYGQDGIVSRLASGLKAGFRQRST